MKESEPHIHIDSKDIREHLIAGGVVFATLIALTGIITENYQLAALGGIAIIASIPAFYLNDRLYESS